MSVLVVDEEKEEEEGHGMVSLRGGRRGAGDGRA